jgi:DNA-binding MarR family transcriptional regulator
MPFMPYFKTPKNSLPEEFMKSLKLNATETDLFNFFYEMCVKLNAPYATREFIPVHPSEKWLARRFGKSREWISKSIRRLEQKRLLSVQRRRRKNGRYAVNVYRVATWIFRLIKSLFQLYYRRDNRNRVFETVNQRVVFLSRKESLSRLTFQELQELYKGTPPEKWLYV